MFDIDGPVYMSYATLERSENPSTLRLILDDDKVMEIVSFLDDAAARITELPDRSRLYVNFSILESRAMGSRVYHRIQLIGFNEITTKQPLYISTSTANNSAEVGKDPIDVDKHWIAGGFLNVEFTYYANSHSIRHRIDLYVIEDHPNMDQDNLYVEMRHNALGDQPRDAVQGKVAFDIRKFLPQEQNSIRIHFSYTDYKGDRYTVSETYSRKDITTSPSRR
jgi:hypothetical protein